MSSVESGFSSATRRVAHRRLPEEGGSGRTWRSGSSSCSRATSLALTCPWAENFLPTLKGEGDGALNYSSASGLVLSALFDETWTGRWVLSEAQSVQMLHDLQNDYSRISATGSSRLPVQEVLNFFSKEAVRAAVKTLPTAAHGLLSQDTIKAGIKFVSKEESSNWLELREWKALMERIQEIHMEALLRAALQNFNAFYGRGQRWSTSSPGASSASLACLRRELLEAAGSSCIRTSGDSMLLTGAQFAASSLTEVGIQSQLRLPFQVGCDDDCMVQQSSPFPPGLLEDLHYFSANNHPLHGIFACDELHPISQAARVFMELAAIGLSLSTLSLRSSWIVRGGAPFPLLAQPLVFGTVLVMLPSMSFWWLIFMLLTCGKYAPMVETPKETIFWAICGKVCGYFFTCVGILAIGYSVQKEGFAFGEAIRFAILGRLASYGVSWFLMAFLYFNPFLAWGNPDPSQGFGLGDYLGLGQWRMEKQRFQARCLAALEATYVNSAAHAASGAEAGTPNSARASTAATTAPPSVASTPSPSLPPTPSSFRVEQPSLMPVTSGTVDFSSEKVVSRGADDRVTGTMAGMVAVLVGMAGFFSCRQRPAKEVQKPVRLKACCFNEKQVVQHNWKYVGKHRGDYEKLQTYNYVGDGLGSYERKQVTSYSGWKLRRCCIWMTLGLPLFMMIGIIFGGLSRDNVLEALQVMIPEPHLGRSGVPAPHFRAGVHSQKVSRSEAKNATHRDASPAPSPEKRQHRRQQRHEAKAASALHDCGVGTEASWSRHKQAWCCLIVRKGCSSEEHADKGSAGGQNSSKSEIRAPHETKAAPSKEKPRYNCEAERFTWEKTWSSRKKAYCCERTGTLGCSPADRKNETSSHRAAEEQEAEEEKERERKEVEEAKVLTLSDLTKGHDEGREKEEEEPKKPEVAEGCKEECAFRGRKKSCQGHILWAKRHFYKHHHDACSQANRLVVSLCPMCNGCASGKDGCLVGEGLPWTAEK